jgi:S1-C subfamily serine protease
MNILDIGIILLALVALLDGFRQGLMLTFGRYAGLLLGLLVGAAIASRVVTLVDSSHPEMRVMLALAVVFLAAGIGHRLGSALTAPVHRALSRFAFTGALDSLLGAVLSTAVLLVATWLVALSVDRGPSRSAAELVQQSAVVRHLDALAPSPPAFLTDFEQAIADQLGPQVFVGLEPSLPSSATLDPSSGSTPGVLAAAAQVVRLEGRGCGGLLLGSGFPISNDQILTNAHVVAGTRSTQVRISGGRVLPGKVILVDSQRDVAVVQVPGLNATPLTFADASRGTTGAAIGYPGGGPERVVPAVVDGQITARGKDIFGEAEADRDVFVIGGDVEPGNSGGPLVNTAGQALGMVFARSLSESNKGFALTPAEIQPDLQSLADGNPILDSGRFHCAK